MATPRERQILMHARSVRGILDGRKTQTRRIVKLDHSERALRGGRSWHLDDPNAVKACPYGEPGDLLWVRETWGTVRMHELGQHVYGDGPIADRDQVVYRAGRLVHHSDDAPPDYDFANWPTRWSDDPTPSRWRPSIFMPKKHTRLWLRVTDVRVERVQGISDEDCRAEGCTPVGARMESFSGLGAIERGADTHLRWRFMELWDDTNGEGAWERNDWVWVISFERTERES